MLPKKNLHLSFLLIFFSLNLPSFAQGPRVSYYYNSNTELSWARCYLFHHGGSRQKIPFLPVINRNFFRAPLGTQNYNNNINIKGKVVFVGNGIAKDETLNCYFGRTAEYIFDEIDVGGKIIMFCYDFPDSVERQEGKNFPLETRISEAARRGASGVILFSSQKKFLFLYAQYQNADEIPEIPVITITLESATFILESAGENAETLFEDWGNKGKTNSVELISSIELWIQGKFEKVETENFLFRFRKELFAVKEMRKVAQVNEQALKFIFSSFNEQKELTWKKNFTVYFRYFDTKLFYTHHWGSGLASDQGIFMVHQGNVPDFGLVVHENTHIFTRYNWSPGTTSFMSEGLGKYIEALATDPDENHNLVVKFIKAKSLVSLEELVVHNIGRPGIKTMVGYPAAGSFVGYLSSLYGMKKLKEAYILENRHPEEKSEDSTWIKVFGKSLSDLEKDWITWLKKKFWK